MHFNFWPDERVRLALSLLSFFTAVSTVEANMCSLPLPRTLD